MISGGCRSNLDNSDVLSVTTGAAFCVTDDICTRCLLGITGTSITATKRGLFNRLCLTADRIQVVLLLAGGRACSLAQDCLKGSPHEANGFVGETGTTLVSTVAVVAVAVHSRMPALY